MKDNTFKFLIITINFLILYNVVTLLIPFEKNANFWISFAFSNIAIITQIIVGILALKDSSQMKEKFYSIPMIKIGLIYLITQFVVSLFFMIFSGIPYWINVIACVTILEISLILLIAANISKTTLQKIDDEITTKTSFIQKLHIDINSLERNEEDEIAKNALKNLSEKVRYSDPVSSTYLLDIENKIELKIKELATAENRLYVIKEISNFVDERNDLCKMMK